MSVKRDRPDSPTPGRLHTPDGRAIRVRLPEALRPPVGRHEATGEPAAPAAPEDPRPVPPRAVPPDGGA